MFYQLPHLVAEVGRKTLLRSGQIWPESWRQAARGLVFNLYEGTDLNVIRVYCTVLLILAIIAGALIITFAIAVRKEADFYYLTRMERPDAMDLLHRSIR